MYQEPEKRGFVYLAYVDDSGSDLKNQIVVVGAVILDDRQFWDLHLNTGVLAELLIEQLKRDDFEEFHAAELFGGYGFFHGVDELERYHLIEQLLRSLAKNGVKFVYAAVNKPALEASAFGSSQPMDVAFRICALGIGDCVERMVRQDIQQRGGATDMYRVATEMHKYPFMLIADDTDDKALKQHLRKSYRSFRPPAHKPYSVTQTDRLWMAHDDMFFGDSKSSIGIQLADICSHIMFRRLRDGTRDKFFDLLAPHAIAARPDTHWSQCKDFMLTHDETSASTDDAEQPGPTLVPLSRVVDQQ